MPVRWGILGAGKISARFVRELSKTTDAQAIAVAASSLEKAMAFASKYRIKKSYGSYAQLAADSDVDVVYIGTTHNFHKEHTILCLEGGKHVLCEKPFAVNAAEAREMIDCARERKLFLMEAMWSRCNPVYKKVMDWIQRGAIGEVRMLKADFGFRAAWEPQKRLLNPSLAGGALLDVGIYPMAMASHLFGPCPTKLAALAHLGKTGVDEQTAILLKYQNGQLAILSSAVRTFTPQNAFILGTEAMIWMPQFWRSRFALLWGKKKIPKISVGPAGYRFEAAEVIRCIKANMLQSPLMPLAETLAIMELMDNVREKIGLRYPAEMN